MSTEHIAATDQPSPCLSCSVIIPTRDQLHFLQPCINSVLASEFDGELEVIVIDNNSSEPETLQFLDSLSGDARIRVLSWPHPFNFSRMNNEAAQLARGEVLCFLNNDIEVLSPDWLERLVPLARRYDVGAVGALLLYPDRSIQHAGIALDEERVACHIAVGEREDFLAGRSDSTLCRVDAVTAACMLTRRDLFLVFGGFNAGELPVAYNDVDYCLRLSAADYPILLDVGAKLLHHESVTRKSDSLPQNRARALKEKRYMDLKWQARLRGHHYGAGMPAGLVFLPAGLDVATTNPARGIPPTTNTARTQVDTPDAEWERQYRSLEMNYRLLESQTRELQQSLSAIVDSRYWHATAPLRSVLRRLTGVKQWCGRKLMGFPLGRRLIALKNGTPLPAPPDDEASVPTRPATDAADFKTVYDRNAQENLGKFLQSDAGLEFPEVANPQVSIVLVFYNKAALSLLCLESILKFAGASYEVIVVDNASADETEALCARLVHARLVRNDANVGFVLAVNQAAAMARGDSLLLLNNDAVLEAGSIDAARDTLLSAPDIGAVGGKIILLDGRLQEAGSIIWRDGSCSGYGRGMHPDLPEFQFQRDVDYCSGAFLMVERQRFLAFGGFDPDFAPAYYEESDFCIRLQAAGLRVVYEPRAVIRHYEFASSGGFAGAAKLQAAHRDVLCDKHAAWLSGKWHNQPDNSARARTSNRFGNLLFIDDRVPHPDLGAGYPRCAEMLREIAGLELNTTFYPLLFPDESWQSTYTTVPANIEVMLHHGRDGLEAFLEQRRGSFDLILVSRVHNMQDFARLVRARPELVAGCRIIYDAEAVTAPREILQQSLNGTPLSREKQETMLQAEMNLARLAHRVVTVSTTESRLFRDAGIGEVIELGHMTEIAPGDAGFQQRTNLLFVGALRDDNSPNVDSLLWFADEILPRINATLEPAVRLIVVGDNNAPQLRSIDREYVVFTGRLDDIDRLYDQCRVFIAPTRFAAGIPRKVHDAAAHGLPVVCTSLLATQLGWRDEQELLVADDPEQFAAQCCRLYRDEALWQRLRRNALLAIQRDCSPEAFRQAVEKIFRGL